MVSSAGPGAASSRKASCPALRATFFASRYLLVRIPDSGCPSLHRSTCRPGTAAHQQLKNGMKDQSSGCWLSDFGHPAVEQGVSRPEPIWSDRYLLPVVGSAPGVFYNHRIRAMTRQTLIPISVLRRNTHVLE